MLDKSEAPVVDAPVTTPEPRRRTRTWTRRLMSFLLGCVVIAAVVVYIEESPTQKNTPQRGRRFGAEGPVPVLAAPAKTADVPVYLDGVGTIRALNTVTVRPQVDGKLIKILFTEGQDVERGYVLAEIDPTTYQAQYDQAVAKKAQDQATLANAKLDLERYSRLAATNAGPKQQADTARATVAQLQAQVELDQAAIDNAKAVLGYTKVTAPIAGRTGIRQIDEGNIVHATDTTGIVVITQLRPISVFFNLPQQQLARINKAFAAGALPVEAFGPDGTTVADRGTLKVVDNQVDQTTGTIKLKAEFPNPNLQLWPGQFVNVRLLIETLPQVVVIPTAALQRGPNGTFVYVVANDAAAMRQVTVTQQDDVQAVVASGLKAGEQVVTTGFARLTDGAKITLASSDGSAPAPPATAGQQRPDSGPAGDKPRHNGARRRQRSEASPRPAQ
jgi:multidrug efflux system membrane fusion protein